MTTRRIFMLNTCAGMAAATLGRMAWADDKTPLKEDDPQAREFGYVTDTGKVDNKKYPDHKPGDQCVKCQIYEDGPNQMGGCPIFAGKLVAAKGWCISFS